MLKEKQFCMKNVRGGAQTKRRAINFPRQTRKGKESRSERREEKESGVGSKECSLCVEQRMLARMWSGCGAPLPGFQVFIFA